LIYNDRPDKTFTSLNVSDDIRKSLSSWEVDRREYFVDDRDAMYFLRRGHNYIVVEMESAHLACNTSIDIRLNGVELEHFPEVIPDKIYMDPETVALSVKEGLQRVGFAPVSNAVCARRVYELDLK
jgi:hypothetical protein